MSHPGRSGVLRLYSRLFLLFLYVRLVPRPVPLAFPWNTIYSGVSSVAPAAAVLFPFSRFLNLIVNRRDDESKAGSIIRKLFMLAGRGLKLTLWLVAFTVIVGILKGQFPSRLQTSWLFSTLILANGILVAVLILLVIRRTFRSSRSLLENRPDFYRLAIVFNSLSVPIQLTVTAVTILWIKAVYPLKASFVPYLDKGAWFLFLLAMLVFFIQIIEILGSRLSTLSQEDTNTLDKTFVEMIRLILKIILILVGIFGIIQILAGKPLTTLLAGLGIGDWPLLSPRRTL